jgi:hypothetical protein
LYVTSSCAISHAGKKAMRKTIVTINNMTAVRMFNVTESEPAWISTISSLDTINYQNSTVKYDVTTTVTGNVTYIYQEEGIVPGMCIPNTILLKKSFIDVYQKI